MAGRYNGDGGETKAPALDRESGFCESTSIFYSKRDPLPLPPNQSLDITSFISSQPHRGKTVLIDAVTGRRLTFSELWLAVERVTTCLYGLGVRKGNVVIILSPNLILYPIVSLSVMSLGAIITTANPINTSDEISKQISDSCPVLAFTTSQLVSKLANSNLPVVLMDENHQSQEKREKVVGRLETMTKTEPSESRVNQDDTAASNSNLPVIIMDEYHKSQENRIKVAWRLETMIKTESTESRIKQRVNQDDTAASNSNLPEVLIDENHQTQENRIKVVGRLETMIKTKPSHSRVKQRVNQDDTAALLYSSGTTGKSKGVMLTHRNLIASVQAYRARYGLHQRTICTIPMSHVYGFGSFTTGLIALGWTIVVLPKFEISQLLSAVEIHRPSYLTLVPPIVVAMVNGGDEIKAKYDLSSLKTVVSGGAPLSREVTEKFVEIYPTVKILQGYGLTESTSIAASMFGEDETKRKRYGSSGLLAPNVEGKIVDPDTGRVLGVNQTGELWIRSPTVMKGYFKNEEATAIIIDSEGWLKTGDLCYIDSDGFVFVVDRLKELIKCNGYQVAPAELEALLLAHPQIADAAVIPIPDMEAGQYPMAYIVRKGGSNLSENEIMGFIAKQVSPYKRIRKVSFLGSIPKNPSGKILRRELIKLTTSKL